MATYLKHAAEIWTNGGPTGDFAEVLEGQLQDAGGNVLFSGSADACVAEKPSYRIPTKLVPTKWIKVVGDVADADHSWQLVVAE